MTRRWLSLMAVMILGTIAAACDGPRSTASQSVLAPKVQAIAPQADGVSANGFILLTTDVGWEDGEITRTALIDQSGGKLNFQASSLVVPPNAVAGPTQFTVTFRNTPYMRAEPTAVDANGQLIRTFPVPLTLTLSYARSKTPIPDVSRLVVLWVDNGVVLEKQVSSVDVQGKKVIARITHFSEYSPGLDALDAPSEPPPPTGGW